MEQIEASDDETLMQDSQGITKGKIVDAVALVVAVVLTAAICACVLAAAVAFVKFIL